jgi:peroxiredoxin
MYRRILIVAIVCVCFALILWSGFENHFSHATVVVPARIATAEPAAQSEMDAVTSPLLGKPAPAFVLRDVEGQRVSLADYRGKAVLINFWATWCAPCRVEMPWFIALQQKYAAQGFTVLGIDQDLPEDLSKVPGFAKQVKLNYPVLYGDKTTYDAYGCCEYLPMSYYIDREGTVRIATIGLGDRERMETYVRRLLEAAPPPSDGRITARATTPAAPAGTR